jgi:ATP adenylyltransferase
MDVLWAPWRMKYIEYAKVCKDSSGCFICDAVRAENLEEHLVLYRDSFTVLLMNKFPYNTGHLLLAPSRHVADFSQLTREELLSLAELLRKSLALLKLALSPDGFNVGVNLGRVAGAGLETHLHVHIVPRWNGDTNFMPVISNTKVIPEALKDTYRRLMEHVHVLKGP